MAKAKKLPSGSWRVQVCKDGAKRSFTAGSKKEAEYQAAAWVRSAEEEKIENITIGAAMEKYCKDKENVLSPATIRGYKAINRSHFLELQKEKLSKVTNAQIQAAVNAEAATLSPKTVANAYSFLSAVIKQYRPEMNVHARLPKRKKTEAYIPEPGTIDALLKDTRERDVEMYIAILLASCMGLRRGEICGLDWEDFDFTAKTCRIGKSRVKNDDEEWIIKEPKTESGYRVVPVSDVVINALQPLAGTGRIISMTPNALTDRFIRIRNRFGLGDLRFHGLRHYMASVMLALGVPDKYAIEIMGHATSNMLKTVYQHTMAFKRDESVEKINEFFTQNIKELPACEKSCEN